MSNPKGVLSALAAFAVFSVHDVVVKFLGGQYSPFQIIFFSTLLSFPLITLMLMRDPTPGHLRPVHPWWVALRTVAGVVTGVLPQNFPLSEVGLSLDTIMLRVQQ